LSTQDASSSALFGGPQRCIGWSIAVAAVVANAVAARVVHASDIDAADFGTVGDVASETTAGTRGKSERAQVG